LRNRIVHGYWSIDLDILLTTAADHLRALAEQLRGLQATLDQPAAPRPDTADPTVTIDEHRVGIVDVCGGHSPHRTGPCRSGSATARR